MHFFFYNTTNGEGGMANLLPLGFTIVWTRLNTALYRKVDGFRHALTCDELHALK